MILASVKETKAAKKLLVSATEHLSTLETTIRDMQEELDRRALVQFSGAGTNASSAARSAFATEDDEDQTMMQRTRETQERSEQYLQGTSRALQNSEETGLTILTDLDDQRERLIQADNSVGNARAGAERAQTALRRMSGNAVCNIALHWLVIVLLVVLIILVLYRKFFS
mmetsp:Transcript_15322/g.48864  ORF Transcript_15322/g.48864 Transcript_15322/m.48864 type:complete len:170 (+) Transcript_15322:437-946(+)